MAIPASGSWNLTSIATYSDKSSLSRPETPTFKWKFIDANAFIEQGILKLVEFEDLGAVKFAAISYTWSPIMLEWRKWILALGPCGEADQILSSPGVSEDMKDFHRFFTTVSFLAFVQNRQHFWMDVLSIDQDSKEEKEFFVPKMGQLYAAASTTHIYMTGSAIVELHSKELQFPIWETRAWTLQEYVLAKDVEFCYCLRGDVAKGVEELHKEKGSQLRTTEIHYSPTLDRYKSRTIPPTPPVGGTTQIYALQRGNTSMTCVVESKWMSLPTSSFLHKKFPPGTTRQAQGGWNIIVDTDFADNPVEGQKVMGRTMMGYILEAMRKKKVSKAGLISTSMALLGGRKATMEEDMMYCVLGILGLDNYKVRYGVGFDQARIGIFEAMEQDVLAAVLGTDWGCSQSGRFNDSALPRIKGSQPTTGIHLETATSSAKYTRDIGTVMTARKERFRLFSDFSRRISLDVDFIRLHLGDPTLLIMFVVSLTDDPQYANINTSEIPESDIRPVILSGTGKISDDKYRNGKDKYDEHVELVELGKCTHSVIFSYPEHQFYTRCTALLALECKLDSSQLVNGGTVLIMDASQLSGGFSEVTLR